MKIISLKGPELQKQNYEKILKKGASLNLKVELSKPVYIYPENAAKLSVDACIAVSGANIELLQELKTLEPVGQANPRPRFHIDDCIIVKAWVAAQKHIIFLVKDNNLGVDAKILKCVLFQAIPSQQADLILQKKRHRISLVGYLQINKFDNSKIDFIVEDCCLNNE